jgi:4-amino-4-deoxy-L-arabinose transferase-like glycosyltransferase
MLKKLDEEVLQNSRQKWIVLVLLFVLVVTLWLPRWLALDQFVTVDEPMWLMRAQNFYYLMGEKEYNQVLQSYHPGITAMWVGSVVAQRYFPDHTVLPDDIFDGHKKHELFLRSTNIDPLRMLTNMRRAMVLVNVVVLIASFMLAWRVLGLSVAFLGFLLLSLEPYHVTLTRIFQLDGLLSGLFLFSVLAFYAYLEDRKQWLYLGMSGIGAGFALLTKSNAIFMFPFVCLMLLLDTVWQLGKAPLRRVLAPIRFSKQVFLPLLGWILLVVVVYFAFFPTMWVNPLGALNAIYADAFSYAATGYKADLAGEFTLGSVFEFPMLRFYAQTFFWRITPVDMIGVILALVLAVSRWKFYKEFVNWHFFIGLLSFTFFFIMFMSMATKVGGHYIISAFPPFNLVAALGWVGGAQWLGARIKNPKLKQILLIAVMVSVAGVQLVSIVRTYPYYITYNNPIVNRTPGQRIGVGYGEGLDVAGRYFTQMTNAEDLKVMSWYGYGAFSYYFTGQTIQLHIRSEWSQDSVQDLKMADYLVIYRVQWNRRLPEYLIDTLRDVPPLNVISIDGIEYVWIYKVSELPDEVFQPWYPED